MTPRSSRSAPAADPAAAPAAQPSSAARNLAPRPARRGPTRRRAEADDAAGRSRRPKPAGPPPEAAPSRPPTPSEPQPRRRAGDRPTTERRPRAGIPVGDWLAAFQTRAAGGLRRRSGSASSPSFLAFLRRRLTGDYDVDEYGFDPEITERFLLAALRPIAEKWFRIEVRGAENIPAEGGALVVSNHSGTVPVDGLMTMVSVHDQTGRYLRPLGADLVFRMPFVGALARKGGATLACTEDAERMLRGGELVGVWPEGFKGIGKPYSERYKLQRFGRGGFVVGRAAHRRPDHAAVGGRRRGDLPAGRQRARRWPGCSACPTSRSRRSSRGSGRSAWCRCRRSGCSSSASRSAPTSTTTGAADDPMLVFNVTDQVRETIQQTLYTLLMQRAAVFR